MSAAEARLPWVAALAAAAATGLQVVLPRLFSVVLWHHLAYFVVSLALLGFAAAGIVAGRRRAAGAPPGAGLLRPALAAAAALGVPLAVAGAVRLPIDPTGMVGGVGAPLLLLAVGALLFLPFALLGALLCAALDASAGRASRTYAASFAGGAAGALLALASLQSAGLSATLGLLGLLPAALAPLLADARRARWLLAAAPALTVLALPETFVPLTSRKHFPAVPEEAVIERRENAFSHVTFYRNPEHHGLWAVPPSYDGVWPESIGVAIDAWAITSILQRAPGQDGHPILEHYPPTIFFTGMVPGFSALVIGAGGGVDVQAALAAGAARVTVVEINPLIVDAVRGRFSDWCGGLYDDPRVEVVVGEGRAFLESDPRRWDLIVLSGVDTFAATQAGAFALSENWLYTKEACATMLARLAPGGRLGLLRWWFEPPRQTLRLMLSFAEVLRAQGVAEPGLRMFLARADRNALLVVRERDFSPHDIAALRSACVPRGMLPLYGLDTPSHPALVEALSLSDPSEFIDDWPYRVDPATDDSPFFFENSRWSTLFRGEGDWIRDRLGGLEIVVASLLALVLLALPLSRLVPAGGRVPRLALALLGAGYALVEVPLLQALSLPLGHPGLVVAVVLVTLLAGSGLGAWWVGRRAGPPAGAARACLLVALAVPALPGAGLAWILPAVAGASFAVRLLLVIALLAPLAALMGRPFALALDALGRRAPGRGVPAAWYWNGLGAALGGPAAVLLAMSFGFQAALGAGACAYLLAARLFARDAVR